MFGKNDAIAAARAAEIDFGLLVERLKKLDTIETVVYRDDRFWNTAVKKGATKKSFVGVYSGINVDDNCANLTTTVTFAKKCALKCSFLGIE